MRRNAGRPKPDETHRRAGYSSRPEAYISGGLHGRCAGYRLAKSYTVTKRLFIKPLSLLNGHLANVRDHGRSTKSSRP